MLKINKKRIYTILEKAAPNDKLSKYCDIFILVLILLNIIAVILETVKSIEFTHGKVIKIFDTVSVAIFTIEYILRIWVSDINPRYKKGVKGKLRYIFSPFALVDIIAIIPFYLPFLMVVDLRMLRLFRIIRLLKVLRYSDSLKLYQDVIKSKKDELIIALFGILFLLISSSSIMYYVEHVKQPEAFSSIPQAMWWSVSTITTVGYGDILPQTDLGRILGSIIAFLGILLFALPAGILSSGFMMAMRRKKGTKFLCPHCSKEIKRN